MYKGSQHKDIVVTTTSNNVYMNERVHTGYSRDRLFFVSIPRACTIAYWTMVYSVTSLI